MQPTNRNQDRRSPVRNLAINLCLAVAAVAVTLVMVEGLARLLPLHPSAKTTDAIPAWVDDSQLQHDASWLVPISKGGGLSRYFDLFEWDRYLFYRLRSNLSLDMIDYTAPAEVRQRTGWRVETNSSGLREPELERPGSLPRFRVAAIGDSSTFGWGVDEPASFVAIAERRLNQAYPDQEIEVVNFGTPGHSSFQGVVQLREVLEDREIDAIWFSFGANDRLPTGISDQEQYARRASWRGVFEAAVQSSHALQLGVEWRNHWLGARTADDIPPSQPEEVVRENVTLSEYVENLRQAAQMAQARGLHFAFVSSCLDRTGIRAMRRVARQAGVPFVNGLQTMMSRVPELAAGELLADEVAEVVEAYGRESLRRWGSKGWVLMPDRCHPNRVGHRLMSEAVAEVTSAWIPDQGVTGPPAEGGETTPLAAGG